MTELSPASPDKNGTGTPETPNEVKEILTVKADVADYLESMHEGIGKLSAERGAEWIVERIIASFLFRRLLS
jgi:hypothetical protein